MPFTRIDGTVAIVGAAPDGDSVRFIPTRPDAWAAAHLRVRANAHGGVQLRLDAIDALETHYAAPGASGQVHQPHELADAAAAALLAALGFTAVERSANQTVTASEPGSVRASILTNGVDINGRCIALLYAEGTELPQSDGTAVFVLPELATASVNAELLSSGLAYPTFYSELFVDLRDALTVLTVAARSAGRGVWAQDRTASGVTVEGLATLTDTAVILPKLFRRLVEYLALGQPELTGFRAFLDTHGDRVLVLPAGR